MTPKRNPDPQSTALPPTSKIQWQAKTSRSRTRLTGKTRPKTWRKREGAGITDGDVAVGGLEHLVHALGPEGGAEDARDGLAGGDVGLLRVEPLQPRLLLLLPEDDEGPPVLVEGERHARRSAGAASPRCFRKGGSDEEEEGCCGGRE